MIVEWFKALNPIVQALRATCFTWFVTAAGAGLVNDHFTGPMRVALPETVVPVLTP